jgi:hypothetical protein
VPSTSQSAARFRPRVVIAFEFSRAVGGSANGQAGRRA